MMQTTKTKKHNNLPKPSLLLKDYLLVKDDLSSCSSNGFKSFPRRQCCTTVGLIFVEKKDLKLQQRKRRRSQPPPRSVSSSYSCSKVSILQKASKAVINAIKSLPLNSYDKKTSVAAAGILSRSFSRKLLSRSFWRKPAAKEDELGGEEGTQRWRTSFRELLMLERDKTTLFNEDSVVSVFAATSSSITSSSSSRWEESEFTFSSCSAVSSSESSAGNDVAEGSKEVAQLAKTVVDEATRDWATNEEKEQFSPVSVLDCPFGDDDEVITPHFDSTTHSLLEGGKHKHMQKRRHFENVASVEPLALEKRMALSEKMQDEQHNNSTKHCSTVVPIKCTQNGNTNMLHWNIEENAARDLLNFVKKSIPSFNSLIIEAENLLFDYFKQSFIENNEIIHNQSEIFHLCKVVEDWINGESQELYLGWEVQEGRLDYITEMDKCAEWRNSYQEVQQLGLEVENMVFSGLVDEIILDLLKVC